MFFYVNSWIHNDLTVAMVGSSVDLTYEYQVTVLLNGMQMVLVRHDPCLLLHFLCIYIYVYIYKEKFCVGANTKIVNKIMNYNTK